MSGLLQHHGSHNLQQRAGSSACSSKDLSSAVALKENCRPFQRQLAWTAWLPAFCTLLSSRNVASLVCRSEGGICRIEIVARAVDRRNFSNKANIYAWVRNTFKLTPTRTKGPAVSQSEGRRQSMFPRTSFIVAVDCCQFNSELIGS